MCLSRARQRRRYHSRRFSFFSYLFARKHATGASETTNGGHEGANKRANKKEKERERERQREKRAYRVRTDERQRLGEGEKNGDKMQQEEREEESGRGGGERAILREKRRDKERRVSCTANGRQTADRDSRASVRQVDQSDDDDDDDDDSAMMSRVSLVTVTRYFDTASRSISRRVARKTEHSDHLGGRGARARAHTLRRLQSLAEVERSSSTSSCSSSSSSAGMFLLRIRSSRH